MTRRQLGQAFIELGKAIQNNRTTVKRLITLANRCGLMLTLQARPKTRAKPR